MQPADPIPTQCFELTAAFRSHLIEQLSEIALQGVVTWAEEVGIPKPR